VANTFTNVLPVLTRAAQVVSREAIGFTRAITLDASDQSASLGQTLNIPKSPAGSATAWTPSLAPTLVDQAATGVALTLSLAYKSDWHVTAEQEAAMDSGAANAMSWFERQAQQAMRVLGNQVDAYFYDLAEKACSRAVGAAGTTPFSSNLDLFASVGQILNENGAPMMGRKLVCNPAAYAELQERFANVASTQAGFSGELPAISNLTPALSVNITTHTKGTGSGYLVNKTAGWAVGDTSLNVDTGSGTIIAGDVVLATTGGRQYVVKTALNGGVVVINDPGIKTAVANNGVLTVQANHVKNLAMTPDAIYGIVRAPRQPTDLPSGWNHTVVVDAVSGIPFGILRIPGDGVTHYSARILYGGVVVESGHIAAVLG
jgi:hypothetical protein